MKINVLNVSERCVFNGQNTPRISCSKSNWMFHEKYKGLRVWVLEEFGDIGTVFLFLKSVNATRSFCPRMWGLVCVELGRPPAPLRALSQVSCFRSRTS